MSGGQSYSYSPLGQSDPEGRESLYQDDEMYHYYEDRR